MTIEVIGKIERIEAIAIGGQIRDVMRLRRQFGPGRWRKLKRIATVRMEDARFESRNYTGTRHGVGRRKLKVKRFLD